MHGKLETLPPKIRAFLEQPKEELEQTKTAPGHGGPYRYKPDKITHSEDIFFFPSTGQKSTYDKPMTVMGLNTWHKNGGPFGYGEGFRHPGSNVDLSQLAFMYQRKVSLKTLKKHFSGIYRLNQPNVYIFDPAIFDAINSVARLPEAYVHELPCVAEGHERPVAKMYMVDPPMGPPIVDPERSICSIRYRENSEIYTCSPDRQIGSFSVYPNVNPVDIGFCRDGNQRSFVMTNRAVLTRLAETADTDDLKRVWLRAMYTPEQRQAWMEAATEGAEALSQFMRTMHR